jgi:hypothetical protein
VLGSRYELVDRYSSVFDWAAGLVVAALVGWLVVRRIRRGRRSRRTGSVEASDGESDGVPDGVADRR